MHRLTQLLFLTE